MRRFILGVATFALTAPAFAQDPGSAVPSFDAKRGGNEKVHMLSHVVAHPGAWKAADIEIEQEPRVRTCISAASSTSTSRSTTSATRRSPKKIYEWTIENPELHRGIGAMDGKYFKIGNRYYYAQSYQFMQGSPDADLGAVIFDVTGLPDRDRR